MLSKRGQRNANQLDTPWMFARGTDYDLETNPLGIISFATAENALIQQEMEDYVNSSNVQLMRAESIPVYTELSLQVYIPSAAFTYKFSTAGGGDRFPAALAALLNEYFHPYERLTGDDVKITSAATALHEILGFALADPGEGILISRPYYGRFELDFGNKAGVRIVTVETHAETCFQPEVVDAYERALIKSNAEGVLIRAVLIINPHNPLGRCFPRETLVALMKLCQKYQVHLISDEIYGLSVFDTGEPGTFPFTSTLSINPNNIIDRDLLHVIYGMSKDFGAAGLRVGALITKNEDLKKSLLAMVRFHSSAGPSIAIATAMLEDRKWIRSLISLSRERLAEAYKFVTKRLQEIGVTYLRGGNAGFFVWIDLSLWLPPENQGLSRQTREQVLAQKFIDAGVFLQPGEEHSLEPGWFRLVYTAVERSVLQEGLRRIEAVLRESVRK